MTRKEWIDFIRTRAGGEILQIHEAADLPASLLNSWQPVGFEIVPQYGRAEVRGEDVYVCLRAQLVAEDLVEAGLVDRTLDTASGVVRHEYFYLPQQAWNHGNARRMIRRASRAYRDAGLARVETKAFSVGKYIWARCGFTFASDLVAETVNGAVGRFAERLGIVNSASDLPFFQHPWDLAGLDVDENGLPVVIPARTLEDALSERGVGRMPPTRGTLVPSKALLIYADYSDWDGVLWLDNRDGGHSRLLHYTEGYE